MLAAIESAKKSVSLSTYIFDNDASGQKFVAALARAVKRGVEVRVLIDAAGTRYSWPPITWQLRHAKIPFARFLPASLFTPWRVATINLRNHRKSLIVDGHRLHRRHEHPPRQRPCRTTETSRCRICISASKARSSRNCRRPSPTTGRSAARETLDGDLWFPELAKDSGNVIARVITDGPDGDFEKARWTLLAALAEAQTSVQIVTPYFLPDTALISALNLAALRGVRVDIILPAKNNLPFVHWASRAMWWQVLERGCHLWLTPPPFDHSKLMIVDGHWVLFGSANWDARSLRLNFELNVECYGRDFAQEWKRSSNKKFAAAREVTLAEADGRPFLPNCATPSPGCFRRIYEISNPIR